MCNGAERSFWTFADHQPDLGIGNAEQHTVAAVASPCHRSMPMNPPLPPFTAETAAEKARLAEDAWNTRDPARVVLAYTSDSRWRNRAEFLEGGDAIKAFLTRKWRRELDYRLIKEVWAFRENRIAVRSRRQRQLVPQLRQRELGIRRAWTDASAHRQHQRSADQRERAKIPLAARTTPRRSPVSGRSRPLRSFDGEISWSKNSNRFPKDIFLTRTGRKFRSYRRAAGKGAQKGSCGARGLK